MFTVGLFHHLKMDGRNATKRATTAARKLPIAPTADQSIVEGEDELNVFRTTSSV